MPGKETWSTDDLRKISVFTQSLQDFLQEAEQDYEIKVSDILMTVKSLHPKVGPDWGLLSFESQDDTTLQFEPGEYQLGLQ